MSRFTNRILTSWTLSAVIAIGIAVFSLAPYGKMNLLPDAPSPAKHFAAYLVFGIFLFYPMKHRLKFLPSFLVMILVVIICTFYGVIMELGQFLSPGRDPSYWDAKMNIWGSLSGQVLLFLSRLAWSGRGQFVSK
jgi:VanZ family protein